MPNQITMKDQEPSNTHVNQPVNPLPQTVHPEESHSQNSNPFRQSPNLLRIHADDQDKKTICIFWTLLFVFVFLLAVLASFAVPDLYVKVFNATQLRGTNIPTCANPAAISGNQVACGTFSTTPTLGEIVKGWTAANQFGLLYLQVRPIDMRTSFTINQPITLQTYSLRESFSSTDRTLHLQTVKKNQVISTDITFKSEDADVIYADDKITPVGYSQLVAITTQLTSQPQLTRIIFTNSGQFSGFSDVSLQSYSINPQFTYYTIILRYIFFGLSIISLSLYFYRYAKTPTAHRTTEQKMVAVASVLLLMFNDPFYPITVLKPNGGSAFFSILFVVNLVVFLLLMWLITADRIYFEDGQRETEQLTKKKIAYIVIVWVELIVCMMIYTMRQINDSPVLSQKFLKGFVIARVVISITVLAGVGYVGFRYSRVCLAPEGKLWRSYIFMVFSSIFIFALFVLVASNSLVLYNYSGSAILLVYGLTNTYIYYLQYMFTITREQAAKLQINGGVEQQDNYDTLTVGTIDIVDVNLEDNKPVRKSYELVEKEEESEVGKKRVQEKEEFQSYEFD